MSMKRIVLTATDYGLAFGIDRSLRELVLAHRLSAVGCIVVSDLWSREYLPLRDAVIEAGDRTMVGLTIVLSGGFEPVTPQAKRIFEGRFPALGYYGRRGWLGLLPDQILAGEIRAQYDRFRDFYGEIPAFVTLQEGLDRRPGLAALVYEALKDEFAEGQTLLLRATSRWGNRRTARKVRKAGGICNPDSATMPLTTDPDQLHEFFWAGLNFRPDNTCVWCRPGSGDDRLRRIETIDDIEVRAAQLAYLKGHAFLLALDEKDVFLF